MKTLKRIAGILILVALVGFYLFALIQIHGLSTTLMVFGAAIAVIGLVGLAVWLITGE